MTRPKIIDAFMYRDEADFLEMRLYELYDVVDHFVIVEADVTHQDTPKPSHFNEVRERFEPYMDKIVPVWATGLPTAADDPDPWARELSQREHIATGLARIGVTDDDIVMQSDVDEIPRPLHVRNVRPGRKFVSFGMRFHCWAVDWLHPEVWHGTVATTVGTLGKIGPAPFAHMRTLRNLVEPMPHMQDVGWHFTWVGDPDKSKLKVASFCHPEVKDRIDGALENDNFYWREGYHVDGIKMSPVEVDGSWPRWIVDGHAPDTWYRPR